MLTILLKFVASAALLFAFYRIVLRGKASYSVSRVYLLLLPVVSLMMSVLSFEVYTPAATEIFAEQFEPLTFTFDDANAKPVTVASMLETEEAQSKAPVVSAVEEPAAPVAAKSTIVINWYAVLEWGLSAISLIMLLLAFWQIRKVLAIKSKMKIESTAEGYELIRSTLVKTPFSFARTIFLPAGLNEHRENLIIRHEKAHIAHRHYADVWFIEFLTRLFWFNPFVWLCRSELRNVHEFQADHDVIAGHVNITDYQTTLLEMVMNVSSPVVSGFNHSFIRQRFIEMKSTAVGTLSRIAKIVTLVWIAGLFCVFTFTACKTKPSKSTVSQKFVIEGEVDSVLTDSCYLIYFADEDYNIVDTPVACVPVIDNKFHFETDLDRLTVCRIRRIPYGGEVSSEWIETFAAPGATFGLSARNGFSRFATSQHTYSNYQTRINHEARKLRRQMYADEPKPEGCYHSWTDVIDDFSSSLFTVEKVDFCENRTIITLTQKQWEYQRGLNDTYFLQDSSGNTYRFIEEINPIINRYQRFVRGTEYAFEPLPKGVNSFNLIHTHQASVPYNLTDENGNNINAIYDALVEAKGIREAPYAGKDPNFTLSLKIETEGRMGVFQLVAMETGIGQKSNKIADFDLDENGEATFSGYLTEPCMALIQATTDRTLLKFPIPLIPGEKAKFSLTLKDLEFIKNHEDPDFEYSGTGDVYKEWSKTEKMFRKVSEKHADDEESESVLKEYLSQNADKLGSALYYMTQFYVDVDSTIYSDEILSNPMVKVAKMRHDSYAKYLKD